MAIVDRADDLTISAANALLKILEEPPERTLFFLLSEHPNRLLPTIRSRCQHLALKPLKHDDLIEALENATDAMTFDREALMKHGNIINCSVRRAFHFGSQDAGALLNDLTSSSIKTLMTFQSCIGLPIM